MHTGVLGIGKGMGAVPLRIVECDRLLQMFPRENQFSQKGQVISPSGVRLDKKCWVVSTLSQADELLTEFTCGLVLRSHRIKRPQAKEHWEKLRALAYLVVEFAGATVDSFYFGSRVALG